MGPRGMGDRASTVGRLGADEVARLVIGASRGQAEPAAARSTSSTQGPMMWQSASDAWRSIRQNATYAWNSMGWTPPYRLLVEGEVDFIKQRPRSIWSNVLVLPNLDLSDRTNAKLSFRGRHLE